MFISKNLNRNKKNLKNLIILLFIFITVNASTNCYAKHELGDEYEGGIIFSLNPDGESGLIMSTTDLGQIQWASSYKHVPGAQSKCGSGAANTDAIIKAYPEDENSGKNAAWACRKYSGGNYHDWYLPSRNELDKMYDFQSDPLFKGKFGFHNDWNYWSSTSTAPEFDSSGDYAWSQYFGDGFQSYSYKTAGAIGVRAVRAFNNSTIQQFNNKELQTEKISQEDSQTQER